MRRHQLTDEQWSIPQPLGRPRQRPEKLAGDEAWHISAWLWKHGIKPVIAHMKRQIVGREVAIAAGKLHFGPWEQIFYGEFDGRRPKRVLIKVIGE